MMEPVERYPPISDVCSSVLAVRYIPKATSTKQTARIGVDLKMMYLLPSLSMKIIERTDPIAPQQVRNIFRTSAFSSSANSPIFMPAYFIISGP